MATLSSYADGNTDRNNDDGQSPLILYRRGDVSLWIDEKLRIRLAVGDQRVTMDARTARIWGEAFCRMATDREELRPWDRLVESEDRDANRPEDEN